jgi:hypothetical protein
MRDGHFWTGLIPVMGVTVVSVLLFSVSGHAQVYSPRRLTQRIAPLLPPPPGSASPASPTQGAAPRPVDPEQQAADRAEADRKVAEFRNQRPHDESDSASGKAETNGIPTAPLIVLGTKCEPRANESMQSISVTLSNAAPAAIRRVRMHLIYYGDPNERPKDWTTQRDLDRPLGSGKTVELEQPAYFMPWTTKHVKIEVKEVEFTDGKTWVQ